MVGEILGGGGLASESNGVHMKFLIMCVGGKGQGVKEFSPLSNDSAKT